MKSLQDEIKFALAEQLMLETVFEHADQEACAKLAGDIAIYIRGTDNKAQDIVAAIYMLHSMHVKEAIRVMDEKSAQPETQSKQIPPWMQ